MCEYYWYRPPATGWSRAAGWSISNRGVKLAVPARSVACGPPPRLRGSQAAKRLKIRGRRCAGQSESELLFLGTLAQVHMQHWPCMDADSVVMQSSRQTPFPLFPLDRPSRPLASSTRSAATAFRPSSAQCRISHRALPDTPDDTLRSPPY
ncbi:hypothetical protein BC628DRAFT_1106393 [Trametes gibbosa]|nr:hypothetical protein BC628DRAFT_1106393 [Trametes gibbosa]